MIRTHDAGSNAALSFKLSVFLAPAVFRPAGLFQRCCR